MRDDERQSEVFSRPSPSSAACHGRQSFARVAISVQQPVREHRAAVYSDGKLLCALLPQVLYSLRSERMLMEQLDYGLCGKNVPTRSTFALGSLMLRLQSLLP